MVLIDPDYPHTSNTWALQVTTDYHLDRLAAGMTPAKKRKTTNHVLYKICEDFIEYSSVLNYMFKVAQYFGHEI